MPKLNPTIKKEDDQSYFELFKKEFIRELKFMYWSEKHLLKFLLRAEKAASTRYLKASFKGHYHATLDHVTRLESVFRIIGVKPASKMCFEMNGLLKETSEIIKLTDKNTLSRDRNLIILSQKIEKLESKKYNTLISIGNELGHFEIILLLEETLIEEQEADETFTAVLEDTLTDEIFKSEIPEIEEEEFEALEAV